MSLPRLVAQIVFVGVQAVTRATVEAGRQVLRNTQAQEGAAAAVGGSMSKQDALTRSHMMTYDEACNILNVKSLTVNDDEGLSNMLKSYEHLFNVNDPKSGSSFYLQSKVVRAKERIEAELKQQGHMAFQSGSEPPQTKSPSSSEKESSSQ